tara:strand:+ start:389 stop:610 length:222 start_codon:yes stop_codon:yes gene_type:complete
MKKIYPKVREVQIRVGSYIRSKDLQGDDWIYGIVIKVDSSQNYSRFRYDFSEVAWENGAHTLYLYGDEEVVSL